MQDLNYDPLAGFDSSNVETIKPLEPLPNGRYLVHIEGFVNKPIKNGTSGSGSQYTFVVRAGEHVNRKIWEWFNLNHIDDETRGRAQSDMKLMLAALGMPRPQSSQAIYGKPLVVEVVVQKDKDGNNRNKIKRFHPASEWNEVSAKSANPAAAQQASQAYAQAQQPPAAAGGGTATAAPAQQRPRGKQSWMG